jgi:hypothetical protein
MHTNYSEKAQPNETPMQTSRIMQSLEHEPLSPIAPLHIARIFKRDADTAKVLLPILQRATQARIILYGFAPEQVEKFLRQVYTPRLEKIIHTHHHASLKSILHKNVRINEVIPFVAKQFVDYLVGMTDMDITHILNDITQKAVAEKKVRPLINLLESYYKKVLRLSSAIDQQTLPFWRQTIQKNKNNLSIMESFGLQNNSHLAIACITLITISILLSGVKFYYGISSITEILLGISYELSSLGAVLGATTVAGINASNREKLNIPVNMEILQNVMTEAGQHYVGARRQNAFPILQYTGPASTANPAAKNSISTAPKTPTYSAQQETHDKNKKNEKFLERIKRDQQRTSDQALLLNQLRLRNEGEANRKKQIENDEKKQIVLNKFGELSHRQQSFLIRLLGSESKVREQFAEAEALIIFTKLGLLKKTHKGFKITIGANSTGTHRSHTDYLDGGFITTLRELFAEFNLTTAELHAASGSTPALTRQP